MKNPLPHAKGGVLLVGAGPGDPGLLTVKAAAALGRADLVVHDGLVDDAILALANPQAELVSVAKQRSRHSVPQEQINQILVDAARAGRTVVRLKCGDPFIFGRGGEEVKPVALLAWRWRLSPAFQPQSVVLPKPCCRLRIVMPQVLSVSLPANARD